jgi:ABC-type sugar transport system permease subunit
MAVQTSATPAATKQRPDPFARGMDFGRIALYIGPALIGIFFLSVVPIFYTMYISLTNRN